MADTWMSYPAAAAALGMTPESVRQRARREHWRKQLANDGKALILVPDDARVPPGDTGGDTLGETPAPRPRPRPEPDTAALQARLVEIEARANELRADLEHERQERLKERDRAERLVGEVADLARQLAKVADEAGARERDLHSRLAKADSDLMAFKGRPWWRRLAARS